MKQGVYITTITGDVSAAIDGKVSHIPKEMKLGVHVTCCVQTKKSSYAYITEKHRPGSEKAGMFAVLFPESTAVVHTGRGTINEVDIQKGFVVATTAKTVTPTAAFMGAEPGECFIEVDHKGRTIVAHTRDTVYNCSTMQAVQLDVNQQVIVTKDGIGPIEPMELRFHKAMEMLTQLGAFGGAEMYQNMVNTSDAALSAILETQRHIAHMTGQDVEKLKEDALRGHQKYQQWAQKEAESLFHEQEMIKMADYDNSASVIPINQSVQYQDINVKITSVKREPKKEGTELLSFKIEVKNDSQKQIFVFWNEEARLIDDQGTVFPIDDYSIETNFMPGDEAKGYLFIPVSNKFERFILQFGKKSLPKHEITVDLSNGKEGGH